jgi:hypothetical protein
VTELRRQLEKGKIKLNNSAEKNAGSRERPTKKTNISPAKPGSIPRR